MGVTRLLAAVGAFFVPWAEPAVYMSRWKCVCKKKDLIFGKRTTTLIPLDDGQWCREVHSLSECTTAKGTRFWVTEEI